MPVIFKMSPAVVLEMSGVPALSRGVAPAGALVGVCGDGTGFPGTGVPGTGEPGCVVIEEPGAVATGVFNGLN